MTLKENDKMHSSGVLTFLFLFYLLPFAVFGFYWQELTGDDIWQGVGREAIWWLFFVPGLFLPYYYGMLGTRIVGITSAALAVVLVLLLTNLQQLATAWFHGLFALTGSFFVAYCVGLLAERFKRSKKAIDVQNRLLKSLYEASELFAFSLNPGDVLDKSLEIIRESLGFDYADIWLLEDENTLRIAASNLPPVFGAPETFPADYCLPGLALTNAENVYVENPLSDDRVVDKTWVNQLGHASAAALPLIHQGERLGVVVVASIVPYQFTPERCELLQTFVNQLTLSIKNAKLYSEMAHKALADELTGLYNHRYFQESLEKEIKRADREQTQISLLMLDLDYFKEYNDTFGHPEGDKLLVEFGSVLRKAVRDSDIAARYGGDEFAIILPNTDAEGARQLAARVADRVACHTFPGYEKMPGGRMSVSIGYATYPEPAANKVELVKQADHQMYKTKEVRRASRKASS